MPVPKLDDRHAGVHDDVYLVVQRAVGVEDARHGADGFLFQIRVCFHVQAAGLVFRQFAADVDVAV